MLKRCVLRLRLKLGRVFVDLTDSWRLFQTIGLATEKAQSPNLFHVCGTIKSRLMSCWSLLADATDSLRYTGQ